MKVKIYISIIVFSLVIFSQKLFSQTMFQVAQYMYHTPFINPASIINNQDINGAFGFRAQWLGIEGAPRTTFFDVNMPFETANAAAGLTIINDAIGVTNITNIGATYAYKLKLEHKKWLAFGITPSVVLFQRDYGKVALDEDTDPLFSNTATPNFAMMNFRFGAYYYTSKFFLGFAVPNLLTNDILFNGNYVAETGLDITNVYYHLHGGYKKVINPRFNITPSALIRYSPGAATQIDLNVMADFLDKFGLGVCYQTLRNGYFLMNMQINDAFKFGYAYGFTLSPLAQYTSGTQELILVYNVRNKRKSYINLPKMLEKQNKKVGGVKRQNNPGIKQPYR
jgi:type IX secretion system PorP/SprF family membrane protein